jgi:uncharacterized protein (DUF433 family)/DNA-binding transcriptional MerR regulator
VSERGRTLIALGEGVYTVPEVARILQPNMTEYKVRRWLHKDLLGEPIRWGSTGRPHLLSFQQLLKVRTIQELRERGIPLQRITPAVRMLSSYLFDHLFDEEWHELRFFQVERGRLCVVDSRDRAIEVETGQWVMPETLSELTAYMWQTREDWERGEVEIKQFPRLVSNAGIVAGSPTIRGTRVETSFIAHMVRSMGVDRVLQLYPYLDRDSLVQAARFEGVQPLAA